MLPSEAKVDRHVLQRGLERVCTFAFPFIDRLPVKAAADCNFIRRTVKSSHSVSYGILLNSSVSVLKSR